MELGLEQFICFIRFGQCHVRVQVSKHMVGPSSHHSVCYPHANFCTGIFPISRSIAISPTDFLCWLSCMLVFMLTFYQPLSNQSQYHCFPHQSSVLAILRVILMLTLTSLFPFNCRIVVSLTGSLC